MKKFICNTIFIFVAATGFCFSETIRVPVDYGTIQAGIDAAAEGDTVLVSNGTYVENINFMGKAITLRSLSGAALTCISARTTHPVVTFDSGEGLDSVIDGFSIVNGRNAPNVEMKGGGIFCRDSSPTIINNDIHDNIIGHLILNGEGGGIFCANSSATIRNNHIHHNEADSGGGVYAHGSCTVDNNVIEWNASVWGGAGIYSSDGVVSNNTVQINSGPGIYATGKDIVVKGNYVKLSAGSGIIYNSTLGGGFIKDNTLVNNCSYGIRIASTTGPTIENNYIARNGFQPDSWGGGILCEQNSEPVIRNNIIEDNIGHAIHLYDRCDAFIIGNIIRRNVYEEHYAAYECGGILCARYCEAEITNNIITHNIAGPFGTIYCKENADPLIINNTICDNTSSLAGGVWCETGITPKVVNCIIRNDASYEIIGSPDVAYCNVKGGYAGTGNIDSDPEFVDPLDNDYHLLHSSPCRDAGNNALVTRIYDFERDPRIVGGSVDIGADEFHPHLYYTGEMLPGGNAHVKLIGTPGATPVGLFIGFETLPNPVQCAWGYFYLSEPWVLYTLWTLPQNSVISLPTLLPQWIAPYEIPLQALIGWELSNLCRLKVRRD
ncbi:MAG: right-handed parallel beta-helix repeat-containing protein [Planctomycetota bacterium]